MCLSAEEKAGLHVIETAVFFPMVGEWTLN